MAGAERSQMSGVKRVDKQIKFVVVVVVIVVNDENSFFNPNDC
jgi:hypothetical protein